MNPLYKTIPSAGIKAATLGVMLIAIGAAGCASNPTGGTNFVLMSERAEINQGRELHEQMQKDLPVYTEPELQAYVNRVGQKMASVSHRPELEYTFTIVDSPDINAFALPGGFIYVNRGLLTFLTSEAQLAAVLGHEIGHVTGRHSVRQQTASRVASVASVATVFATGTTQLMETADLFSGALISGYGRDMELEADGLGAEYLARAGYDPLAMVEVITVLKNQEDFRKKTGQQGNSYHGVFATHPRNDTRLREVVSEATSLAGQQELAQVDPAEFRGRLTGLPIGQTLQSAGAQDRNRYYQNLLNYTLIFPDNWNYEETPTTVTAHSPDGAASLKVEVQRLQENKDPRRFVREDLGIEELQSAEILSQYGLPGYTGIDPATGQRVAAIYYGPRAFILSVEASGVSPSELDEQVLASIKSFRPIARNELAIANPVHVEYIQANGRVTYADLARGSRVTDYPEDLLRLMNGDYPRGEPEAGEWVKIAK